MQGMRVAAEPFSAPPYATECTMTLSGMHTQCLDNHLHGQGVLENALLKQNKENKNQHD